MHLLKFIFFVIIILLTGIIYLPLLIILLPWRKKAGPMFLHLASRLYLKLMRVIIDSDPFDKSALNKKTVIILSNHVNILDIFLLSALFKASFVAKIEIPPSYQEILTKNIKNLDNNGGELSSSSIGQVDWWNPGIIKVERKSSVNNGDYVHAILSQDEDKLILYLEWVKI